MAYTPTNWQNNRSPALNETNLNKLEAAVLANDVAVTGKAPLNHTHTTSDIPDLDAYGQAVVDAKDAATLTSAKDYTYSQATINSKDAATLTSAKDYTYSQATINSKDAAIAALTYPQATIDSKDATVQASADAAQSTADTATTKADTAQAAADAAQVTANNAKEFASGTRMVFYGAAPVGWAIFPVPTWSMLMAGSVSAGFVGGQHDPHNHYHNTGDFALQEQHNGPHTHTYNGKSVTGGSSAGGDPNSINNTIYTTGSSGSGTPHNHGQTAPANLKYATVTICQKS